MQATQASRDLARAEAEIELLQKLLKEMEEQFQSEIGKADAETAASDFQKEETEKLKQLLKGQKAEIDRLRSALDQAQAGDREEIDGISNAIAAVQRAISQQNDAITNIMDPVKWRGHLYYMPTSSQASTPASQSTKDSGVSLQCPMPAPYKKRPGEGRQSKKECSTSPAARELQEGAELNVHSTSSFVPPPGSVAYALLPDGAPAPQATVVYGLSSPSVLANGGQLAPAAVIYGSPPVGAQVVGNPLPAPCSVPLVPVGVHHCNVPEHRNLEKEISRLQDSIDKLKSQKQKGECRGLSRCMHNREIEELHQGIQDLLSEREELEFQVTELRRIAQKRRTRKDFIDGHISGLISELELEKSLQHHENIVGEIDCVEKTLLKRRAELREADRLLAEAENEFENTRGKTKDTIQKYNSAKQHLSRTEKEAEELERRAQEMAVRLVKADQQLRFLQADTKDLEEHKTEQEGILKDIKQVISAKDSEFLSLSQKIEILTESLQKLQADIQVAEGNEDHHLQILKEAEYILQSKKSELERLKDQTAAQQQEVLLLDRLLNQKREELLLLEESIAEKTTDLKEALRDGEAEVAEKRRQIKEVKSFLEDLSVQKGELSAQLSEKRAQLSLVTKDVQKEEEKLQDVLGRITKHKTELKHVLEMVHLENGELEGLELQHSQKLNELEKMQVEVLEEQLELETLQQASQQQHGEAERQRQLLERIQQDTERLNSQLHSLQNSIKTLSVEKQKLEENCESLEEKWSEMKRALALAEDSNKAALSHRETMESEVLQLQLDTEQLQKRKLSLNGEVADLQKHLHEKEEELTILKTELNDSKQHLQLLEQDVRNATQQKEALLREQAALKESISEYSWKCKEYQEVQRRKENQLQKLCREIEGQQLEQAKQEQILHHLKEEIQHEEKDLEECTAKLKAQKRLLEQELAGQQGQLERVMAKVQGAEERVRKLQEEEAWCTALEETLSKARHQLSEKEEELQEKAGEVLSLQRELELSKTKAAALRDQIQTEQEKAGRQIASLKEAIKSQRAQLERALHEQKQENHYLQKEVASMEQVAQDNHLRAKQLMRDLGQIQEEYLQLRSQVKSQENLEKQQKEMKGTAKSLKLEVKDSMRAGLKNLSQPPTKLSEDLEATFEANRRLQNDLESLKENYPFTDNEARVLCFEGKLDLSKVHITDEQWRGKARREQLQHREDRLKAQLRQCMSKQVEVLIKGKQQTEGTLHSLKRQVDALDELVSSTSTESLFPSLNSSGFTDSLQEEPNLPKNQFSRSPSRTTVSISAQSQALHQYKA